MPNLVEITVRVNGDKAVADLSGIEDAAKASGKSAGTGFTSEFGKATTHGGGSGLLGALFGGSGTSIEADAEQAGQRAGMGLGRGMEQKFSSTLGSGLLSGLLGTSAGTKLFSSAGNTVVQDAAMQGEKIAQGLSEGLESGLAAADTELTGAVGDLFAGAGGNVTTSVQVTGIKDAEQEIGDLEGSMSGLSDDVIAVSVTGITEAETSVESLKDDISSLSGADAIIGVQGISEAEEETAALIAELDDLRLQDDTVRVSVSGASETAAELGAVGDAAKKAEGDSQGFREQLGFLGEPMGALIAAGVVLSPVLVTAGVGLAGFAGAAVEAAKPILAAAEATGGLQNNLQTLSPQQQVVARELISLQQEFGAFAKSMQPEVFSAFDSALSLAKTLLGDVEPVAKAAGGALDTVLANLSSDFQGSEWKQFFTWMAQEAEPDVQMLGNLFISVANDLPPLLEGLQPLAVELLDVATGAAKAVGALEGLPTQINKVSDSNDSLLSKASNFLNMVSSKIPDGNRSLVSLAQSWLGAGNAASTSADAQQKAAAVQQQAVTAAGNLSNNLITLEDKYGLTASQAEALVKAAGQTDTALEGSGTQAAGAEKAVEGYANASLQAQSPTTQLANDILTLNNNTLGATAQLTAFGDAWDILVGNSVTDQQAVLQMAQAFQSYTSEVKQSESQSTQSQSDFLSYVSSIETNISTMQKSGDSVEDVNSAFQTQITRLGSLHGLNAQEQGDVAGVTKAYDTWANSTDGLNNKLLTASGTIKDDFTANLKGLGEYTPAINTDVNNLANSILKTGTTSSATKADRTQLLADLAKVGITGKAASDIVDALEGKIGALKGKTVTVGVAAKGSEQITATENILGEKSKTLGDLTFVASGGRMPGFGGGDILPAMLEPGEAVVDKYRTRKYAALFKAMGVPGFESGGLVSVGGSGLSGVPGWAAGEGSSFMKSDWPVFGDAVSAAFMLASQQAAVKAVTAANQANPSAVPGEGTPGANYALAQALYPEYKGTSVMAAWNDVAMRESGWNQFARNPSSGAYGIPQALPESQMPFAAQSAGESNPTAQIEWMWDYMASRYGGPIGADQHEISEGWYDNGGWLKPGKTLVHNNTGQPEQVIPPGGLHITLELGPSFKAAGLTDAQLNDIRHTVRTQGGGNVQTAFGKH